MTVKCMYFDKKYQSKPDNREVCVVQKSLIPIEIDIKTLATGLAQGCTFRPAVLSGRTKDTFQCQELFCLDFDHGATIDEVLQQCKDINLLPTFAYTSFSHLQNGEHRFRLVFHCQKLITDPTERNKIQLALMAAFPKSNPACKNADRLFFGGKSLICENYDKAFNPDDVVQRFYKPPEILPKSIKTTKPKQNKPTKKNDASKTRKLAVFDNDVV